MSNVGISSKERDKIRYIHHVCILTLTYDNEVDGQYLERRNRYYLSNSTIISNKDNRNKIF